MVSARRRGQRSQRRRRRSRRQQERQGDVTKPNGGPAEGARGSVAAATAAASNHAAGRSKARAACAARLAADSAVRRTAALRLLPWWTPPQVAWSVQQITKAELESVRMRILRRLPWWTPPQAAWSAQQITKAELESVRMQIAKAEPESVQNGDAQLTEEMVTWYRRPSGIRPPEVAAEHNTYHNPIFLRPPRQCSNVQGSKSPKATEEYWRRHDTYLKLRYTLGTIPEHSAIGDAGDITFASGEEEADKAADAGWNMAGTLLSFFRPCFETKSQFFRRFDLLSAMFLSLDLSFAFPFQVRSRFLCVSTLFCVSWQFFGATEFLFCVP